jgi:hypothetical protein
MNDTAREFERLLGQAALKPLARPARDVQELLSRQRPSLRATKEFDGMSTPKPTRPVSR